MIDPRPTESASSPEQQHRLSALSPPGDHLASWAVRKRKRGERSDDSEPQSPTEAGFRPISGRLSGPHVPGFRGASKLTSNSLALAADVWTQASPARPHSETRTIPIGPGAHPHPYYTHDPRGPSGMWVPTSSAHPMQQMMMRPGHPVMMRPGHPMMRTEQANDPEAQNHHAEHMLSDNNAAAQEQAHHRPCPPQYEMHQWQQFNNSYTWSAEPNAQDSRAHDSHYSACPPNMMYPRRAEMPSHGVAQYWGTDYPSGFCIPTMYDPRMRPPRSHDSGSADSNNDRGEHHGVRKGQIMHAARGGPKKRDNKPSNFTLVDETAKSRRYEFLCPDPECPNSGAPILTPWLMSTSNKFRCTSSPCKAKKQRNNHTIPAHVMRQHLIDVTLPPEVSECKTHQQT